MRPALLRRVPSLRSAAWSVPVLPADAAERYPGLADDLDAVRDYLAPAFDELDRTALQQQNRYRRQRLLVSLGAALVTGLGGLEAGFPRQWWPGVVLGVVSASVAAGSRVGRERTVHEEYLTARVQAERLRALHFRYLFARPPFDGADGERRLALRRAVSAVRNGKEPS
ncbi:MAG: DUF4231 domain-containing protein [Kineosporiaceae bacterium]